MEKASKGEAQRLFDLVSIKEFIGISDRREAIPFSKDYGSEIAALWDLRTDSSTDFFQNHRLQLKQIED